MDEKYKYPDLSLLECNDNIDNSTDGCSSDILLNFFNREGINAEIAYVKEEPIGILYAIKLGAGVRVKNLTSLKDDIALELATSDIQFIIPVPGTTFLGIVAKKTNSNQLLLGDLIQSNEFVESDDFMEIIIGRSYDGKLIPYNFNETSHLLISGTTGSGKSVFIDSVITSLLYKGTPDELKLVLIDTRGVNLVSYNNIPHLLLPVVTDAKQAYATIHWVISEMNERYSLFKNVGARNIKSYNEHLEKYNNNEIYSSYNKLKRKMPHIMLIIDDFADLMELSESRNDMEKAICQIAQMSRAAGIHLIISTQRPSTNVVTGVIKANIPNRISFSTASIVDSKTILDCGGAEQINRKGEMLFKSIEYRTPLLIQGPYITMKEINKVVDFLGGQNNSFIDINNHKIDMNEGLDELFVEVGLFIIKNEKASIGAIQRAFKIGFNRASRIMDQLEIKQVVGPELGTKPRSILMNESTFKNYFS